MQANSQMTFDTGGPIEQSFNFMFGLWASIINLLKPLPGKNNWERVSVATFGNPEQVTLRDLEQGLHIVGITGPKTSAQTKKQGECAIV